MERGKIRGKWRVVGWEIHNGERRRREDERREKDTW
jgi:hypothetical protein